jgi:hypothetical protein
MSAEWSVPRPIHHLRVFTISLAILGLCLIGMLFGVQLEAVVPATGIVTARDILTVRAKLAGLVEPGWYEGTLIEAPDRSVQVRLDADGSGITDPAAGPVRAIRHEQLLTGEERPAVQQRQFHRLQRGDLLWPGQPLATIRDEALRLEWLRLGDWIKDRETRDESSEMLLRERDRLRDRQSRGVVRAPESAACWLVLDVAVDPLEQVNPGDALATIVPADAATGLPRDLVARLEIEERHWGAVMSGAKVRLQSAMFNPRLFGHAEARIDRLEPLGEPAPGDGRRFHALAPITHAPFALGVGSSFRAEISIGHKPVYRIILEH